MENENPSKCPTGDPGDTGEYGELGPTGTCGVSGPTGTPPFIQRIIDAEVYHQLGQGKPFVVGDDNIRELLNLTDDEVRLLKSQLDKIESTFWNILLGYTLCFHDDTAGKVFDIFMKRFDALADIRTIQCVAYLLKRFQFVYPQSQKWD